MVELRFPGSLGNKKLVNMFRVGAQRSSAFQEESPSGHVGTGSASELSQTTKTGSSSDW